MVSCLCPSASYSLLAQLVEAVLACNRHGIAHRDIKVHI
jgi:serine/threonine protein kinase